jgi:hypothetical protein
VNPFALASDTPDEWLPGLAQPKRLPPETIVAYPVGLGETTKDLPNGSAFTHIIANQIRAPGTELLTVFRNAADALLKLNMPQPWFEAGLSRPFFFRDPIHLSLIVNDGDDDVYLRLSGQDVLSWQSRGNTPRDVTLALGDNPLEISVYNRPSYTGGVGIVGGIDFGGHRPEGWRYSVTIKHGAAVLWEFRDGEDTPPDNGSRHGRTFVAGRVNLHVDARSGEVSVRDRALGLRP